MTSRHDIDTGWANDLGDDDGEPRQRHSGMDRTEPESFDPAAVLAALPPRGATADMPAAMASFDDLGERPSWHEAAATPPQVAAAWATVLAALEAAVDAAHDESALTLQQASAERIETARVTKLIAAGREAKPSTAPDWSAGRRHLAAVAAGHRDRARRARGAYDALVLEHQPTWCASIIASLPGAKAATIAALTEAGDHVERLLAAASAAQTMQLEPGGSLVALPVLQVRRFVEAAQELADEVEASEPLGGVGLCHPAMTPSWAERQQIGASLLHGVVDSGAFWLAELERREQYRLSAFTRGIPLGEKPSEPTW